MCIQLNLENYIPIKRNIIQNIGALWGKKENCKIPKYDQNDTFYLVNYSK